MYIRIIIPCERDHYPQWKLISLNIWPDLFLNFKLRYDKLHTFYVVVMSSEKVKQQMFEAVSFLI